MKVAVLTSITNDYDILRAFPTQDVQCETICVTDNPTMLGSGWNRIIHDPRPDLHPNLAAKGPKMCPWRYTDADLTIWIDGSLTVQSPSFVREMCAFEFGQFNHPDRDCIYDELEASRYSKYDGLPIDEQVAHYRTNGHPDKWGLWATGLIVRKRTPEVEEFGEDWLAECEKWTFQDQLSEAPMLRIHGLRPETIPGSFHSGRNPWLAYSGSARH